VHAGGELLNVPVLGDELRLTDPVGVVPPGILSDTVTVQLVG
jgi:hypothetical protein